MKSILVIDMPNDADVSKIRMGGDGNIYYIRDGERASIVGNIRNIKPLPQKRNECYYYGELAKNEFAVGFNSCLNEILGEAE
jgi:hypothetical protein